MLRLAKRRFITIALSLGALFLVPAISSAQSIIETALFPSDPDFVYQPYLNKIHAQEAWDIVFMHTLKRDVVIALLDTGVDLDHPDLKNIIWKNTDEVPGDGIDNDDNSYIDDVFGWDFVESVPDPNPKLEEDYAFEAAHHGTVVAGIIAAEFNNKIGIAGAGMNVKIMPLRVFDSKGAGNTAVLASGIDYAVENGADIINLSLVGEERDERLEKAINDAYLAGVAIVASAGNQDEGGINLNESPRYPVCDHDELNRVLGVAALDSSNRLAAFSNYGSKCTDISAPGTDFYSTKWQIDGNPDFEDYYSGGWSGTSVATPLVSAALALILQTSPNLSVDEMYRAVMEGALNLKDADPNYANLGAGVLDLEGALASSLQLSRHKPLRIITGAGVGERPEVTIRDQQGRIVHKFDAYDGTFRGGLSLATGDVDGDGEVEIITAPMGGGSPHVRIFDVLGNIESEFMAYRAEFKGGVNIGVGDVHGDGQAEIVTSPRSNGGPHLRMFNYKGEILNQFMAYAPDFYGGVSIAVGDMNRDGIDDIVTVPSSLGGPHVRIFNREGSDLGSFMAYDPGYRGGLSLAIGNFDNVRGNELAITQLNSDEYAVSLFDDTARLKNKFYLYADEEINKRPVKLLSYDYTGDLRDDILAYPVTRSNQLRLYDFIGVHLDTYNIVGETSPLSYGLLQ